MHDLSNAKCIKFYYTSYVESSFLLPLHFRLFGHICTTELNSKKLSPRMEWLVRMRSQIPIKLLYCTNMFHDANMNVIQQTSHSISDFLLSYNTDNVNKCHMHYFPELTINQPFVIYHLNKIFNLLFYT